MIGVSPPAWGRRLSRELVALQLGCIPTCVGQTITEGFGPVPVPVYPHLRGADTQRDRGQGQQRVYPHLRGADSTQPPNTKRDTGVSPPAWGRPVNARDGLGVLGCIPTCVGQTTATDYGDLIP